MRERRLSDIRKIIIHCSDSEFGDAQLINDWHAARGFDCIGYHFVVTNGRITADDPYDIFRDGVIEPGRPIHYDGAHCRGHNHDSIGICLIGRHHFTARQILLALPEILGTYMALPSVTGPECVFTHAHFAPAKTCPNFSLLDLRFLAESSVHAGRPITSPIDTEALCLQPPQP